MYGNKRFPPGTRARDCRQVKAKTLPTRSRAPICTFQHYVKLFIGTYDIHTYYNIFRSNNQLMTVAHLPESLPLTRQLCMSCESGCSPIMSIPRSI